MYLAWKAGASAAIGLQIRDSQYTHETRFFRNSSGIYFYNGKPKPAVRAFRFPFVAEPAGGHRVRVWGKSPRSGKVVIEARKGKDWNPVASVRAAPSRIFFGRLTMRRGTNLRARAAGETSLPWKLSKR